MKERAGEVAWGPGAPRKLPNLPAQSQLLISDKEQLVGRIISAEGAVPTVKTLAKKIDKGKEVAQKRKVMSLLESHTRVNGIIA